MTYFGSKQFIVPTFDTKVTEYLCSGWVFFFFRQISTFLLAIFDGIILYHSKGIVALSLNLKKNFTCYEGLKIDILAILTNFAQLTRDIIRAINA